VLKVSLSAKQNKIRQITYFFQPKKNQPLSFKTNCDAVQILDGCNSNTNGFGITYFLFNSILIPKQWFLNKRQQLSVLL